MLARQSDRLDSVQLLRALAAFMIVLMHAQGYLAEQAAALALPFSSIQAVPFGAGVDLFFVISGFIIVVSSERFFAAPGGRAEFLKRRLCRIVPLYWFTLTLRILMLGASSLVGIKTLPSLTAIATSFAFIPYDAQGYGPRYPFPVLDQGWSLNYEMMFYALFAAVIWMPRLAAGLTSVGVLFLGVLIVWVNPPESVPLWFWFQPIVLEFALGIGIALMFRHGVRLGAASRAGLLALGLSIWLIVDVTWFDPSVGPGLYSWARLFVYGSGAGLILSGAVLGSTQLSSSLLRRIASLGDSSYALYLLHRFVILGVWLAVKPLPLSEGMLWPIVIVTVLLSVAAAHVFHCRVEKPVVDWLQRRASSLGGRPMRWRLLRPRKPLGADMASR